MRTLTPNLAPPMHEAHTADRYQPDDSAPVYTFGGLDPGIGTVGAGVRGELRESGRVVITHSIELQGAGLCDWVVWFNSLSGPPIETLGLDPTCRRLNFQTKQPDDRILQVAGFGTHVSCASVLERLRLLQSMLRVTPSGAGLTFAEGSGPAKDAIFNHRQAVGEDVVGRTTTPDGQHVVDAVSYLLLAAHYAPDAPPLFAMRPHASLCSA